MSSIEAVITRLKLCLDDIKAASPTKLKTTYKYAPMPLKEGELPVGWLEWNRLGTATPNAGTADKTIAVEAYIATHAIEARKFATSGYVAELEEITQIADVVDAYFEDHLNLSTTEAPAQRGLAYLSREIEYSIEAGTIAAKDGKVHVGLRILFTVYLKKDISRKF